MCLTLCDPMDHSPPGSSVHGILQARILERVAIPFSRGSSQPRSWTWISCVASRFFTIWATRALLTQSMSCKDFSTGLEVKISPSNARGAGSAPGWGAKIPHALQPKNQNIKQKYYYNNRNNIKYYYNNYYNRNNIITNSIKTFKIVHIQKDIF